MKRVLLAFLLIVLFHLSLLAGPVEKLNSLRCEYLTTPLGIDVLSPRLSWKLPVGVDVQKAYQLIVGTDSASVARGVGNSWDSGKVLASDVLVAYSGKAIQPYTRYYWKVCVWDNDNVYTSDVTYFETGVMDDHNWKGSWISDTHDIRLKPAAYFRKALDVKRSIKEARAYIAVAGLYELYINGSRIGDHRLDPAYTRFDRRTLYLTHDITQSLKQGDNAVGVLLGNV